MRLALSRPNSPRRCYSGGLRHHYHSQQKQSFCLALRRQWQMANKKRGLILCTGNSARSQMAEGLLRHAAGDRFDVESAGVKPRFVRPEAITVMNEIGIDISGHRSKSVEEVAGQQFDYVITVCGNAAEACPVFPGNTQRLHLPFDDPAVVQGDLKEREAAFRKVRDQIKRMAIDSILDEKNAPH